MLPVDAQRLKIQKTDRRMTGHTQFKYRLEFPWAAFSAGFASTSEPYHERTKLFYDFCRHLTEVFGYGPSVDDATSYTRSFEWPKWGFRLVDHTHTYAIYMADETIRSEVEKLLAFKILKS